MRYLEYIEADRHALLPAPVYLRGFLQEYARATGLEPTFASIQHDIFETTDSAGRQACTVCHTSTERNPAGGMNVNHDVAYDQLVNAPVRGRVGAIRVIPGDPDNSYLIQKLEGRADIVGRRMPFNGPPFLTDGQILIIRRWIAIGAPRN